MSVLSHEYRVARPPKALTFEDSLVMLGKLLSDPGCEIMLGQKITMKDSISMKAFTHPCRALGCKHVQCFDFEVYLHMNRTRLASEYCCPICQQISNPSKIYVDTVFLCLLQILPEDCTVSLMKNGTFEVTLASKPAMEIINVDDDEEEEVEDSVFSSHQKILGTVAELVYIVPFTAAKSRKNHVTLRQLATASLDDVLHLLNVDNAWGINTIPDITELLQQFIKNKRPYACTTDDGLKYCLRQVDGMGEVRAGRIVTHFYNVLNKKLGGFLAHIQSRAFVSGANGVLSSPVVVEFLKKKGKLKLIKPPTPVAPVAVPATDPPTPEKRAPGSPAGSQSSAYSTHTAHSSASSSGSAGGSGSAGSSSSSEGAVVDLTAGTFPATTRRKKGKHSTANSTTSSDRSSANERVRTNSIISVNSTSGCEDTDAGSSSSVPLTTTTRPATTSYSAPLPHSSHHSHHASTSVSTVPTHISASSQPSTAAGRAKGSSAIMGEGIADVAGPPALTRLGRGPGGGGGGGNTVLDPQRQAVAIDLCDSDTDRSVVALPMAPIAARSPSRTPRSARRGSEGGASGAPSTVSSPASSRQHKRSREQPVVVDDNSVNSGALQVQAHKRPRASTSEAPPLTHDAASVVSDSSGLRSIHSAHSAHSGDSASAPGVSNGARTVTPVVPDRVMPQQQSQVLSPVRDHSRRPSTTSPPPRHTTSTTTTHPSARGAIAPGGGNSHIRFSSSPDDVKPSRAELGLPAAHRSSNGNGSNGNGMAAASLSAVGVNSNGANGGQASRPAGFSQAPVLVIPPRSRLPQTVAVASSGASSGSSSSSGNGSGDGGSTGAGTVRVPTAPVANSAPSATPSNNTRPTTAAHTSNNNSTPTTAPTTATTTTTATPTPKPTVTGPARSRDYTEQDSKRPYSPALTMRHDQRSWLQVKPNYHYGLVNKRERDVDPGSMSGAAHCEANHAGGQVFQPRIAPSRANPLHAQSVGLGVGLGATASALVGTGAWPANAHIEPAAETGGVAGHSGHSVQKEQSSGVYVNRDGDHVKVWSAASPAPVAPTGSTAISTSKTTSNTAAAYPPRTPRQRSDSRERRSRCRDRSYTSYNNNSSNYRNTNYNTTDKPDAGRYDRSSRAERSNDRNSSRGRKRSRDRSNTSRNSNNSSSYYSGNTYNANRYASSSRGRDNSRDRSRDRDRSGSSRSDRDRGATGGADSNRSRYSSDSYDYTTTSKSNTNTSTGYNNANTTTTNDTSNKPYNPSAGESGGGCRNYSKPSYYKPAAEERGARGASAFPSPAIPLAPPLVPCVPVPAAVNGHESAAGNDIKTTIDTNKVSIANTTSSNRLWRPPVPATTTRTTTSTTADTAPSMIQRAQPAVPRPVVSVSSGGSSAGGASADGSSGGGTVVNGAGGASSGSSTNSHGATTSNSGSVGGNGTVFGKSAVTSTSVSATITSVPATTAPAPLPPKTFAPKLSAGVSNKTINKADTTVSAVTSSNSGGSGGVASGVASPNGKTHIRFDEPSNTSTTPNDITTKQTTTTITTSPTTNALTVSGGLHSKRATSNAKLDTVFGNNTAITTSTNTTSSNTTPNSAASNATYSQSRVVQLSPPAQNGSGNYSGNGSYSSNGGSGNSWSNNVGSNYNRNNNNSSTYNNNNNNYRNTSNNGTYRNNSHTYNNAYNPGANTNSITNTSNNASTNRSSDTVAQLVTKDFIGSDH